MRILGWALLFVLCTISRSEAVVTLSERDWQELKKVARGVGSVFPASPALNDRFLLVSDSGSGSCEAGVGSAVTLCLWDGVEWVPFIDGVASESDTLATVTARGNTSVGNDENNPYEILGTGSQSSYGLSIDRTSTGESRVRCKEPAGLNKCHYYRQIDDGFEGGFTDKDGVKRLTVSGTTGATTNMMLDCTAASNNCTLLHERDVPVATCQNASATANFDLPTTNAAAPQCEGTNYRKGVLAFNDTTDQSFHDQFILPAGYAGMTFKFRVKAAATTGAFGLCVRLARVASTSDPSPPSQTTSNCGSFTIPGTTLNELALDLVNPTCTGCVAGDHVVAIVERDANGSAVTDSMTGDLLMLTMSRVFTVVH